MEEKSGFLRSFYRTLASLKLTVAIFLILAAASLLGTLLPQGLTPMELQRHYGPNLTQFINVLGLGDLYHTSWFRLLLFLLCLNLVVCTIERLPKTLKLVRRREDHISPEKLLKFSSSGEFSTKLSWEQLRARLTQVVSQDFAEVRILDQVESFSAVAEKGRWGPLMVYVVHVSVLVILLGALMGSILGFKGFMNLPEGETSKEVVLSDRNQTIELPFQVRCDEFEVSYYDTGMPKEFRSDLTIIDNGKEVLKQALRVNDPLTYRGVTFYQSSYGSTLKEAEVDFLDRQTGQTHHLVLALNQPAMLPGTTDRVEIMNYQEDLSRFGPAVAVVLTREGHSEPTGSWILIKVPEFHGNRIDKYQIKVMKTTVVDYTGLQVKEDPGVWMVWIGFSVMLTGIGLTYYVSHRKVWIWASPPTAGRHTSRVVIAGRATKNPLSFELEFNRLFEHLQTVLETDSKGESKT